MMRRDRFGASAKKDTVHTTLKNKLDDANRMSHDTLSSNITGPTDRRRSSSQENDCSTCNSSMTSHWDSDTRQNKWMRIFPLHLITLSLLVTNITAEMNCTNGISTLGYTWPHGDIVIQYDNPLHILCTLNETYINATYPGKNASDIQFRTERRLLSSYVTIVNRTTASLYILRARENRRTVYCELRLKEDYESNEKVEICKNTVIVGYLPSRPDLNCTSYNWERLECEWSSTPNSAVTNYSLEILHPFNINMATPCPPNITLPPNKCIWGRTTNYLERDEHYVFLIHSENVFGSQDFTYEINNYANVIPNPPSTLDAFNPTTQTILLQWVVPDNMKDFPAGFHHRIMYHSQYDDQGCWKVINITNDIHLLTRMYRIRDLPFPNAKYYVRVYIKSAEAIGEEMWSDYAYTEFQTLPTCVPSRIMEGSFSIVENTYDRDLYLYWKPTIKYDEYGDYFRYRISYMENDHMIILNPQELTGMSAKIERFSLDSYQLEIAVSNILDGADYIHNAEIFIPFEDSRICEPMEFRKRSFDEGIYELNWLPPVLSESMRTFITYYTIIWCQNDNENPKLCASDVNWKHVSNTTTSCTVTVSKPSDEYQFAIAANTDEWGSSGMVWASNYARYNQKGDEFDINHLVVRYLQASYLGSRTIEISWKQVCSNQVEGYNIYYCPARSPHNLQCKSRSHWTSLKDPTTTYSIIEGLTPHTVYALKIRVMTKYGEGPDSNVVYNITLEDAPSTPPRNLGAIDLTNTTVKMSWDPPKITNGIIRTYQVHYNEKVQLVKNGTSVTLMNLVPYTMYNISVVACTVLCSKKSRALQILTSIGVPRKIDAPTVNKCIKGCSDKTLFINWNAPRMPAGLVLYELWHSGRTYTTPNIGMKINIMHCDLYPEKTLHEFRVRVYNVDFPTLYVEGPWSDAKQVYCTRYSKNDKEHVYTEYVAEE